MAYESNVIPCPVCDNPHTIPEAHVQSWDNSFWLPDLDPESDDPDATTVIQHSHGYSNSDPDEHKHKPEYWSHRIAFRCANGCRFALVIEQGESRTIIYTCDHYAAWKPEDIT